MRLVVSFSSLKSGFVRRAVQVDIFVERVALGKVFLRVFGVFPDSRHSVICRLWIGQGLVRDRSFTDTVPSQDEGKYRGADKSLARTGRKQATATEDFDVHISYLLS